MPLSPKIVTGHVDSVPCPHCNHGNDFREIEEELALTTDASGTRSQKVQCDACDQYMEVVQIKKSTLISVRQTTPT